MRTHLVRGAAHRAALLLSCLAAVHCSSAQRAREAVDNPNTVGATGNTVTVQGSVQGQVSNSVIAASSAALFAESTYWLASNSCADTNFVAYAVGGNLTVLGTGNADAAGNFTLVWNEEVASNAESASEVVLVFDCNTVVGKLKCYGHPGDTDLPCDTITNAVVVALQNAVNANVEDSKLYAGLSIAKIVEGLVQTLKLVSQLNPNSDFVSQLQAATTLAEMESIIEASPVGALFNSIQTLVQQQAAKNLAQDSNAQTTSALQTVWNAQTTIQLLVGLGLPVTFNLDANQYRNTGVTSDLALYGEGFMDQLSGTTFMAQAMVYISNLYNTLYVQRGTAPVTLLCQAQAAQNNYAPITYAPDPNGPLYDQNNNVVANANALTCLGPTAVSLGVATALGMPGNFYIQTVIGSPFSEADRNNPQGTQTNTSNLDTSMPLLDVFQELIAVLQNPNTCGQFYVPNSDGSPGPGTDWAKLVPCLKQYNADKYIAGAIGVYRFLTDTQLSAIRVSLDDIYAALVDGMGLRLVPNASQYTQCISITVSNPPGNQSNGNQCFPLMLLDAMQTDPQNSNNEVFYSVCPYPLCINGVVQYGSGSSVTITQEQLDGLLNEARPGFQVLMKDLLNIPTLSSLQTQIFTSAHHVDYNIAGSQYFSVVGIDTTGGYSADIPILCVALDANNKRMNTFVPGQSTIHCEPGLGTWQNGVENPNLVNYKDYTGWYALSSYGTSVQGLAYYGLTNLYDGTSMTLQGQQFRLIDFSANPNLATTMNVAADNKHLYVSNAPICQSYVNSSGQYQENCYQQTFDYVAVTFPPTYFPPQSYQPFYTNIPLTVVNPVNQVRQQINVQVALNSNSQTGGIDPTANPYSLCISQSGVSLDPNWPSVIEGVSINVGTAGPCSSLSSGKPGTVFYYPVLTYSNANNTGNYNYNIIRNDGLQMIACPGCGPYALPYSTLQSGFSGLLGPTTASTQILTYNLANPSYNSKFDPFCADLDEDGRCDCLRGGQILNATSTPTDASCNLGDGTGNEPTLSQLPLYGGDANVTAQYLAFSNACGGLAGVNLQGCAEANPSFLQLPLQWNAAVYCAGTQNHPAYVVSSNIITNPNMVGACDAAGDLGPVQLIRVAVRDNAYDIAQPQTAMKLISAATQNTGTGITLRPDQNVFAFPDAVSMEFFRLAVLPNISVYGPNPLNPLGPPSTYGPLSSPAVYTSYNNGGGSGNGPGSAILRQFLAKANLIPAL